MKQLGEGKAGRLGIDGTGVATSASRQRFEAKSSPRIVGAGSPQGAGPRKGVSVLNEDFSEQVYHRYTIEREREREESKVGF